jgi:hypothetical protein
MAETITFQATESNETITVTINEQARGPAGADGATGLNREVKSASFTAENGKSYSVVATATVTDPSPVEGKGYNVLIRNGTVTIGGTAYSLAGTTVERVFHSGAWASYPYYNMSTGASTGGNGAADAGKLAKFDSSGGFSAYDFTASNNTADTAALTANNSGNGTGANANSAGGYGLTVSSFSGNAALFIATSGTYHAEFGNDGVNRSFVARVNGAFGWVRGAYTARIEATATLTANRTHTLGDWSGDIAGVTATQTLTNKTLTSPSMSAPVVTGTARMTMASVTGTPEATDAITRADGDARFGAMIVMKVPNDKDITAGSLTDIPDTEISLDANSDYDISGFFGVQTTGGSPTNRVLFRMAYTGTLQTNQGFIGSPNSSGAIFAMVNGAILTTSICDTSNIDRSYPITGSIRTSTAGTLKIQAYRVTGSGTTPKLLGGSLLILRKL